MKISVILGHPDRWSFNHAIAETVVNTLQNNGHEVLSHDLYEERFDPLLTSGELPKDASLDATVANHCAEIATADGIVIIHPNWWGQPPAILKGRVDGVIRPGVANEFVEGDSGEGVPVGLLKAKSAVVFNTSNTEPEREIKDFGDPVETIWKNCIFALCRVEHFYRKVFGVVVTSACLIRSDLKAALRRKQLPYQSPMLKLVPGAMPIPSRKAATSAPISGHGSWRHLG